jgi:flagellar protein FliS
LVNGRFVKEYQKNAVNGASPLGLIIMLYDGALRFIETGKQNIADRDYENQNFNLQKAQKIVMELMSCLDMARGGEISKNLFSLYTYVLNELIEANIKDSPESAERGAKVLRELRESWVIIEERNRKGEIEVPVAA